MNKIIDDSQINKLFQVMKDDYNRWQSLSSTSYDQIRKQMFEEYCDSLEARYGNKYIKIVGENSVKGFIVNTHQDKKFQFGDLLMAAGWNKPARNFARGNIFDDNLNVRWTGIS